MFFWSFSAEDDMLLTRTPILATLILGCAFLEVVLRFGKRGYYWTTDW